VKRDLRHALWFMAVVLPVAIVLTLLTSGDLPHSSRTTPAAPRAAHAASRTLHRLSREAVLDRRTNRRGESRRVEVDRTPAS
jgi:hypothetical protein